MGLAYWAVFLGAMAIILTLALHDQGPKKTTRGSRNDRNDR